MRILKLSGYFYPEQISSSHLSKDLDEAYLNAGFTFVNYVFYCFVDDCRIKLLTKVK